MSQYFKKKITKELTTEIIWKSAIKYQLEIGEIEINEELQELMADNEKVIARCKRDLEILKQSDNE